MKLIKPFCEILEQLPGISGIYKQIEFAGRTCYKSHDKITSDSAKEFVDRMVKSGHGAMLEHGTVYLKVPKTDTTYVIGVKYETNKYSKSNYVNGDWYVTTNLRVLVENDWLEDLQYVCEPTEHHERRITVKFVCDRGVSHEFVRHRVFSFAQESTRYCNYSKDKFGNEITYILPCWLDEEDVKAFEINKNTGFDRELNDKDIFLFTLEELEEAYKLLIEADWKPQQARAILPNALKTELIMTGFISDWKHFFKLRDAGSAHPQARELAKPLHEEFIKLGYI